MKRVKFYCDIGYVGCEKEEIVEYEDDVSEKDIDADFQDWLWNNIDAGWYETKEGEVS